MTTLTLFVGLLCVLCGYTAWRLQQLQQDGDPRLKADLERKEQEIGELKNQMTELQSTLDKKLGEGKQLYADFVQLKAEHASLTKECNRYQSEEELREQEKIRALQELTEAKNSLEEEKKRIRREDEERQERELEERDRMWAEHENTVIAHISDLCRKPQLGFPCFDNTNLPEEFDGSLKPDCMIEFLGQYIIFDAKVSKSQDLQSYISSAVQSTAKKVKKRKEIFTAVFLVVPTEAISSLKKLLYKEDGFLFHIVSPEAIEPILYALRRIADYELAEQFDPQDREKIVGVLADFGAHINERNAFDVLMAKKGIDILSEAQKLPMDVAKEVATKNVERRLKMPKSSDVKRIAGSTDVQNEELSDLTEARAPIALGEE